LCRLSWALDWQAFWKILSEGRHMMPPLKDALTEQQMTDIQAWLKTLP
jgi:cytochrome c553